MKPAAAPIRSLPSVPRIIAGLLLASIVPYLALAPVIVEADMIRAPIESHLLLFSITAGQSLVFAGPIVLWRWPRMRRPLEECQIIGALAAPGPLGYFLLIVVAPVSPMPAAVFLLVVALMGAVGGGIFWAVATSLGRQVERTLP